MMVAWRRDSFMWFFPDAPVKPALYAQSLARVASRWQRCAGGLVQNGGQPILLSEQVSLPCESPEVFERCVMIAAADMQRLRLS